MVPAVIFSSIAAASQRSERKVREVNVGGTERLVEACLGLAGPDVADLGAPR